MISDADVNALEYAITDNQPQRLEELVARFDPAELSSLEIYGNATLLMHACERGTAEMVKILLGRGVQAHELEWSDNNELKAAVRNSQHGPEILPLVLSILPKQLAIDMITTDWDPDDQPVAPLKSALQLAQGLKDKACKQIFEKALEDLRGR
jgi:ankyrin repeat protein